LELLGLERPELGQIHSVDQQPMKTRLHLLKALLISGRIVRR
jgi:aryl-alcohol dehydrogenase-like predicted oxidoreductase